MKIRLFLMLLAMLAVRPLMAQDTYNQIDEMGNVTQRNQNFNKHNNDTTSKNKEVPKGLKTWTVDRKFGNIIPTQPDTVHHLFPQSLFNSGVYGQYNTIGNNYSARQNRIFIDRKESSSFIFTDPYSFFMKDPDEFQFTNTLSPLTYLTYDNCGDKQHGEDRLDAKFAVNVNKRLGFGFQMTYDYARGYYNSQSVSHFNGSLFATYLGDRYNAHFLFSTNHQKATENGGITNDEYILHPESYTDAFTDDEIPTVLTQTWNRNDNIHVFLSHRYNIGFYRQVPMTEEELKAREFAKAAMEEKEKMEQKKENPDAPKGRETTAPKGRPEGAAIAGMEPPKEKTSEAIDTTRIQVDSQEKLDSLNRLQAIQDSIDATMKKEYVPVTSIIHTLELHNYKRTYLAYTSPKDYYFARNYSVLGGDSIDDITKHLQIKNTFGLALLEGFNKYMKAGLKAFVTHEYRRYIMPDTLNGTTFQQRWTEQNVSIGGQINKTEGKTLHFNLTGEFWVAGEDASQMKLDFNTDLNFALFKDTVRVAAKAFFHRLNPSFYYRRYHSQHLWWDKQNDFKQEMRTRIEGNLSYSLTNTRLRLAIEEIQNYTYFGMSYDHTYDGDNKSNGRKNMIADVYQEGGNINLLTAQLYQDFRLGPLNWENIITYQNSSNTDVLPLPDLNIFSNLYLKFKIARVLDVELGGNVTYFTKYEAPDFCPTLNQFAVQKNTANRVELGEFPFVDVYANLKLKGVRFFVMMSNVLYSSANRKYFTTPHYPMNGSVIHMGVSWPFFN
ncbi:MAG: putative porin [Prevotella sp.]|nr:putative porin [Prevotella sp.]